MDRYQVEAHREGSWWALEFPAVDSRIHSQVRRLEQAPAAAADALTFWFEDADGRTVTAEQIDVAPMLDGAIAAEVADAVAKRTAADDAARVATDATRQIIKRAVDNGLTVRDVGQLLGVSHQYVAQVAKSDR